MAAMTSSLLALALFVAAAQAQYGFGAMPMHPALHMEEDHLEPKYLTCLVRFRDPAAPNNILNAIAVNIMERPRDRDAHAHSHQGSWMGMMGPLMGQQQQDDSGLEAYVQMFSTTGGPVSIAFTDAARPEEGCAAKYGNPMMMKYGNPMMKYGNPMMKYGNPMMMNKMAGPYNPMMMRNPAMGHMMGGHHPMMHMMDMDDDHHKPEGVFAETDLAPNMKATINIDRLEGFKDLSDLAGRGVIVCPTSMVDHQDDDAICDGGILACCSLHYDENKQMLS